MRREQQETQTERNFNMTSDEQETHQKREQTERNNKMSN